MQRRHLMPAITFGIMDQQHAGKVFCARIQTRVLQVHNRPVGVCGQASGNPAPFTGTVRVFKYNATHWDDGTGMGVWVDQGAPAAAAAARRRVHPRSVRLTAPMPMWFR